MSRALLQQLHDALMVCTPDNKHGYSMKADALHNIRSALAQNEAEPVAWIYPSDLEKFQECETFATVFSIKVGCPDEESVPLYAAHAAAPAADNAGLREVLWVLAEHNELHFGKNHSTVMQARAALEEGGQIATPHRKGQDMTDPHTLWAVAQLTPGEGIEDGVARIAALLGEVDCRTCKRFYDWEDKVCTQSNKNPCTNGDRYDPLPPVRLWRTT